MVNRDFVWNLVFIGTIFERYTKEHPRFVVEWSFPDEEVEALKIYLRSVDNTILERKYLLYYEIEELDSYLLKNKIYDMLDEMSRQLK